MQHLLGTNWETLNQNDRQDWSVKQNTVLLFEVTNFWGTINIVKMVNWVVGMLEEWYNWVTKHKIAVSLFSKEFGIDFSVTFWRLKYDNLCCQLRETKFNLSDKLIKNDLFQ